MPMNFKQTCARFAVAMLVAVSVVARAQTPSIPSAPAAQASSELAGSKGASAARIDMQYRSTNEGIMVLDDGVVTRVQLPPGTLIPVFISVKPQGEMLLVPKQASPFLVLKGVHTKLLLQWANGKSETIVYLGTPSAERLGAAAAFGLAQPQAQYALAAKPVDSPVPAQKTVTPEMGTVAPLAQHQAQPLSQGAAPANDAANADKSPPVAAKTADVSMGEAATSNLEKTQAPADKEAAPSSGKTVMPAAPLAPPEQTWEVKLSDVHLANTLNRWAKEGGYRVIWEPRNNYLVEAPNVFKGSFEQAVAALLSTPGIRTGMAPLEACVYPNVPPLLKVSEKDTQEKECQ